MLNLNGKGKEEKTTKGKCLFTRHSLSIIEFEFGLQDQVDFIVKDLYDYRRFYTKKSILLN